jgi:hypothetical protein
MRRTEQERGGEGAVASDTVLMDATEIASCTNRCETGTKANESLETVGARGCGACGKLTMQHCGGFAGTRTASLEGQHSCVAGAGAAKANIEGASSTTTIARASTRNCDRNLMTLS